MISKYARNMTTVTKDEIMALEQQIMELKQRRTKLRREAQPEPVQDYELKRPDGSSVMLSDLFGDKDEMLLVHNMGTSCSYCTLWADGMNGRTEHRNGRAAVVVALPDDPSTLKEFSEGRGWRYTTASIEGSTLAHDLGFYMNKGEEPGYWPGVSALKKTADGIVRTGRSFFGPGDDFCAIWPLMDLLPEKDWAPKYSYKAQGSCGSGCACH